MKRNEFFKRIGLGAVAAIVAPKVLAEIADQPEGLPGMVEQIQKGPVFDRVFLSYGGEMRSKNTIATANPFGLRVGDWIMISDLKGKEENAVVTGIRPVPYLAIKYRNPANMPDPFKRTVISVAFFKKNVNIKGNVEFIAIGRDDKEMFEP